VRTVHLRSESAGSPFAARFWKLSMGQQGIRRTIVLARANSALKLASRRSCSRRPSRLRHVEFARRRAACTGNIVCAASGAPLEASPPVADLQLNVKTLGGR